MTHLAISEEVEVRDQLAEIETDVIEVKATSEEVAVEEDIDAVDALEEADALAADDDLYEEDELEPSYDETEAPKLSLLEDLDARQDNVLLQLDELNTKVEQLIGEFMRVRAAEGEAA